ncbi:type IV pilin [Halorhabdus salina]|uniref:type IV pilin n=1 Tax=Halorhabdus salina TaxID=2750670 RepID=UPI002867C126|nr:type IV pilin [Halorhabdus salina]
MIPRSSRAATPVIGNILLVAIVVILAATVSVFALGFADDSTQPGPIVGQSSGELISDQPTGKRTDQIVRLTHIAGDDLDVSKLEIAVDATDACGKQSRIVNLPTNTLGSANYDGDNIFDYYSPDGGELDTSADGIWSAGETATFRIKSGGCKLNSGDTITVRVVHTPTNAVVIEQTLSAT